MKTRSASSRSAARARTKKSPTSRAAAKSAPAEVLDTLHDAGGDMSAYLDTAHARRPGREVQRVNVDFPVLMLQAIDREAARIGVSRQAFIKLRLADGIDADRRADTADASPQALTMLMEALRNATADPARRAK